jgi:hemerythrin
VCINLLTKYETEHKKLIETVAEISERLSVITKNENDVALFIDRLKKYVDVQELTREMCLELIEYITVDAYTADKPREIHIYYKLLDKPLDDKRCLYSK